MTPSPSAQSARPYLILTLVVLAAMVAQSFGRFAYGVIYPALRDDLQISNTLAALLGASNVSAYLAGTLVVAWTAAHVSLLNTFRLGLMLATLGLLIVGASATPLFVGLGLAIAGFGGACVWIPAPAIAADAMPARHRSLAIGLMGSGIGIGIVFVSLLAASRRAALGDPAWSEIYQVQAVVAVVVLFLASILVTHTQQATAGAPRRGGFGSLQRMPGWRPLLVGYAAFGFMYLLIIGFLTTRLEDDSGWHPSDASYAFTLMGCAMIIGAPLLIAFSNRVGVREALRLAFALWPVLVLTALSGTPWLTLPAIFGLGMLFSAIPSLITVYVVQNTTLDDYGSSFAAATLAFGVAQVVSPPMGGLIADLTGAFTWVFLLSALIGCIGLLAITRLPRTPATETVRRT